MALLAVGGVLLHVVTAGAGVLGVVGTVLLGVIGAVVVIAVVAVVEERVVVVVVNEGKGGASLSLEGAEHRGVTGVAGTAHCSSLVTHPTILLLLLLLS